MPVPLHHVDAFTSAPFGGNPAAVCLLDAARDERWMQNVAAEMNLSETAFLVPRGGDFDLRWFTPAIEVALCGHATLASAHVLWDTGRLAPDATARFHTKSGLLTADRRGGLIELNFPATFAEAAPPPDGLAAALGAPLGWVGRSKFDYLVELDNDDVVRMLQPDFAALRHVPVRGVIVTSRASTPDCDFVSRFFATGAGIDEDPVTGSAHCALAPFWAARLGKREFVARQLSRRGGELRVSLDGDRVRLGGHAVTVLRGELVD